MQKIIDTKSYYVRLTRSWKSGDERPDIHEQPIYIRVDQIVTVAPSLGGGSVVYMVGGNAHTVDQDPDTVIEAMAGEE